MKRIFLFVTALVVAAGCEKSEIADSISAPATKEISLGVNLDAASVSRVAYEQQGDEWIASWEAEDKLKVWSSNIEQSEFAEFEIVADSFGDSNAEFSGSVAVEAEDIRLISVGSAVEAPLSDNSWLYSVASQSSDMSGDGLTNLDSKSLMISSELVALNDLSSEASISMEHILAGVNANLRLEGVPADSKITRLEFKSCDEDNAFVTARYIDLAKGVSDADFYAEKSVADGSAIYSVDVTSSPVVENYSETQAQYSISFVAYPFSVEAGKSVELLLYYTNEEGEGSISRQITNGTDVAWAFEAGTVNDINVAFEAAVEPGVQIDFTKVTPTLTAVWYSCTPSDAEATYVINYMTKEKFESYANDAEIIAADVATFSTYSKYSGGGRGTIKENLYTGSLADRSINISAPGEYYIFAYGIDEEGVLLSNVVSSALFAISPKPVINVDWDEETAVSYEGGSFTATISVENPIEGVSISCFIGSYNIPVDWAAVESYDNTSVTFTVDANPESEAREASMLVKYSTYAYLYVDFKQEAKPLVRPAEDVTFVFENVSTTTNYINFDCIPSDKEATYVLKCMTKAQYDEFESDEAMIAADIARFESMYNSSIKTNVVKGDQSKNEYLGYVPTSGDYYIIAYGLMADGTVTSSEVHKVACVVPAKTKFSHNWNNYSTLAAEEKEYTITYSVTNPIAGTEMSFEVADSGSSWIHIVSSDNGELVFTVDENTSSSTRESRITYQYGSSIYDTFTIEQKGASPSYY